MDDSPRSSKRRKLDTSNRTAPSPPTKSANTRSSGRLSNRTTSKSGKNAKGVEVGEDTKRQPRATKKATNTASRKQAVEEEKDVYDDIEGALGLSSKSTGKSAQKAAPKPRRALPRSKAVTKETSDEIQKTTKTPRRINNRKGASTTVAKSVGRSTSRVLANGHDESPQQDDEQDESVAKKAKSSKSSKKEDARKTPARKARSTGRPTRGVAAISNDDDTDGVQVNGAASKLQSVNKAARTRRKDATPEIEDDEAAIATSRPTRRRAPAKVREPVAEQDPEDEEGEPDDMNVDEISVVGSVLDPTEPSPFYKPSSAQKEKPPLFGAGFAEGRESDLLKTIIMERIMGKRPAPLVGLDEEYKTVYQLIEHTVTAGEGNSMLLIGARGSGKSALVKHVLSEVSKSNSEDYHVVRLNGFIHTDDKVALREIWRQLGKEMEIEDDSGPGKNYADTLTTLLALLSHPSEQTGEVTDQVAKAVIFVMDEFDLFAQHPRQTLLYNLFDIAQSRKAPIAVLGLTTRVDVTNSLEKRVKSRFSHRYVHLSLAKSFTAFQEVLKTILTIQSDQLSVEERSILETAPKNTPSKKAKKDESQGPLADWNSNIDHLAPHFYRSKSVPTVLNSFLLPTATISPGASLLPTNILAPPDSKLTLIPQLSTLSLSLLIAAARLDIIHDSDTCNFNMAYDEYVTLASRARIQSAAGGTSSSGSVTKVWGKDVARREWEGLVELGFIMPIAGGLPGGFAMVKVDVALEEIGEVIKCAKGIEKSLEKWCKQI
ncbi:P-loop containing nucleoside triphosphate hydrolase protein [Corynespora cassiicola Philippines]|uniref:Origin recognition complex subunit 4 n=1 Tax=Corynespora cassiicola Philippines TaxID=1448308 RepID=A0A2T2NUR7_CORCC|nr:P-loop containing nucleoside triphosphate hydrolase protein [Corynespora cassiicola Philippines]